MERTIPSASVCANPLTLPVPIRFNTKAAISVVILPSKIADKAFWNPVLMDAFTDFPAEISSRIRA